MNIYLDIKSDFVAQVVGVIQSLNQDYFNSIKIEPTSQFMKNQQHLAETLEIINKGKEELLETEDFWQEVDKQLG